ncbi:MAG: hypothetical protein KME43_07685 [Myxacorys chilensis ATA2-1-KO14]|jgi:hypothetical protein|nr:hypothetical protein [Myxacorys chilensis ATA2-1-KO14]
MRNIRRFLGALTICFSLAQSTALQASVRSSPSDDPSRAYWLEAQQLTQEQLVLLSRVEQSLTSTEPNRLRSLQGQLFLQTWAVDRFLKSNYPNPSVFCLSPNGEVAGTDAVDLAQGQVYCGLYFACQNLEILRKDLARRSGIAARPLRSPVASLLAPQALPQDNSLVFNLPEGTIIGSVIRLPAARSVAPDAPTSTFNAVTLIKSARQWLARIQPAFPQALRVTVPIETQATSGKPTDLYANEAQPHAQFLQQPNTGIARLLPTEVYFDANLNRPQNRRFAPLAEESYPLPVLSKRSDDFSARLAVRVTGNLFQLVPSGIDYGFMADLGDVTLENLLPSMSIGQSLSLPEMLKSFYTYRPPTVLEAISADQRHFAEQSLEQGISSFAPAQLNRTYLVRSLQFKLPELLTSGRPVPPNQRQSLKDLLKMPSSDLLFAFRPVSRRSDGSYTVLWRLLIQFPDPQIRDLEKYVGHGE